MERHPDLTEQEEAALQENLRVIRDLAQAPHQVIHIPKTRRCKRCHKVFETKSKFQEICHSCIIRTHKQKRLKSSLTKWKKRIGIKL